MEHPFPVGTLVKLKTVWTTISNRWEAEGHRRPEQVYWPSGWASLDLMTLVAPEDGRRDLFGMVLEWMDASTLGTFRADEVMVKQGGCYLIYHVLLVADSAPLWFPWTSVRETKVDNLGIGEQK